MRYIEEIINTCKNFIFPHRCVACDNVLSFGIGVNKEHICKDCVDKIIFIDDISCKKCGSKLYDKNEYLCERCKSYEKGKVSYYDYGFGLCRYVDTVKESIHRFKYQNRPEYIEFYGKCIASRFKERYRNMDIDCFVPVPIHKTRFIERNYNQAEMLARHISKNLRKYGIFIKVDTDLIVRCKRTKSLNKLSDIDRANTLKDAFIVNNNKNIKSVCIIDDIYTTGSTIETMSKILKENGVEHIYFTTVAVVDNL